MPASTVARQNVYAAIRYADAPAAIRWLKEAFGFEAESVYEDTHGGIAHAEIRCGADLVMVGSLKAGEDGQPAGPEGRTSLYVAVEDTRPYFEGAKAAGATVVQEPHDTDYGSRGDFAVVDPQGQWWSFGTYRP
jgi:uncharacterized glyoxalase superfamily protein PhnB